MKVSKSYTLYVNAMLGEAYYGTTEFSRRIFYATFGDTFTCNLSQLIYNLNILKSRGYTISCRKY